ncbi:hypothetical protein [Endozoicomonas sp.]|uniref:hypothetical protein n=1 Tax=Endozoicomonas sp. TaxID=1892382 RepID=UPI0028856928|nr:hypothetical protein [Endozoicomonas sp.]
MSIAKLVSNQDQRDYQRLITALGSENNPSQWLEFMAAMHELLPEILTVGKPSKNTIEKSLVGRLGFPSWRAMLEAPKEEYGLGWTKAGWDSFKRAWNTVSKYPYLKSMSFSAGYINKYAHEWRDEFPESADQFNQKLNNQKAENKKKAEEKRTNSVTALNEQIQTLQEQVLALNEQLKGKHDRNIKLESTVDEKQNRINELDKKIESLTTKNAEMENKISSLQSDINRLNNRSFWEKLKDLF